MQRISGRKRDYVTCLIWLEEQVSPDRQHLNSGTRKAQIFCSVGLQRRTFACYIALCKWDTKGLCLKKPNSGFYYPRCMMHDAAGQILELVGPIRLHPEKEVSALCK